MASPPRGESRAHWQLKRAALLWAQQQGFRACGTEIRVPTSAYRADVAAYRKATKETPAATVIFECKQSRADFLNHGHALEESRKRLASLNVRRRKLEGLLKMHYPSLSQGDSLFAEYASYDLERIEHQGYRKVIREIQTLETRIYGRTKFEKMAQYRCADFLYVVTCDGVAADEEIPLSWGVLMPAGGETEGGGQAFDPESERPPKLEVRRAPVHLGSSPQQQLDLLYRLAVSGTRRVSDEAALDGEALYEAWNGTHRIG